MIHHSPLPDVEIPDLALTEYVLAGAAGRPGKPALIDGASGRVLTYGELERAIGSLAGGLAAAGFGPGDVLALLAPNMPEYAVVFHGVAMAGGTITTINPVYTEAEVHRQLADSGARLLVTITPLVAAAVRACRGTAVTEVYVLGEPGDADGPGGDDRTPRVSPLSALSGAPTAQVPVGPDDVVALPYSSGTTGLAKGVMLTHRNLVANVAQTLGAIPAAPDEVIMAVLPFFHIYGMQCMMNCGLRSGGTVVTLPRFDLEQFLRARQLPRTRFARQARPPAARGTERADGDHYPRKAGIGGGQREVPWRGQSGPRQRRRTPRCWSRGKGRPRQPLVS